MLTIKKPNLDAVRIVLVEPQVPGNVGAAARAMKNMGLRSLVLVKPWFHDHPQSRYMAHGSEDILEGAGVFENLDEAVFDSILVVAHPAGNVTIHPLWARNRRRL